ncbi:MAG: hypothetical protein SNJ78_09255 [Spirochaetales bacterium]
MSWVGSLACRNSYGWNFVFIENKLYVAEEVFFVGTGWEIMPVASVDRISVGSGQIGPITKRIAETYRSIVLGKDRDYKPWLQPVWE